MEAVSRREISYMSGMWRPRLIERWRQAVGEFNIGTSKETSIVSLAEELRAQACPSAKIIFGPAKAGEQLRSVIDNSLAGRTLSRKPTVEMGEGLHRTLDWYRTKPREVAARILQERLVNRPGSL